MSSKNNNTLLKKNLSPKAVIEGLLFVRGSKGIYLQEIKKCLNQPISKIKNLLDELTKAYQSEDSSFILTRHNDLYCLRTKTIFYPYFSLLQEQQTNPRLTAASLETLAIIAYKGPISRWEIENIRKLSCRTVLHNLIERNLIQFYADKQNTNTFLYEVTDHFLKIFNIASLAELPEFDLTNLNVDPTTKFDLFNDQEENDSELDYKIEDDA